MNQQIGLPVVRMITGFDITEGGGNTEHAGGAGGVDIADMVADIPAISGLQSKIGGGF